ncbi:hypothetical protein Tco_0526782 [Tanacetum coccineum]
MHVSLQPIQIPKRQLRYKKQDQTVVPIGSEEDERAIKKMNEQVVDKENEQKAESVHEEIKEAEGAKKRKLGTRRKLKAKRRKYTLILDHQYPIVEWQSFFLTTKPQHDPTKPLEDVYLNRITRSNGHQRFFSTLMGVLSILDREDLKAVYEHCDMLVFWDESLSGSSLAWKLHSSQGKCFSNGGFELKLKKNSTMGLVLELIKFVKQQLEEFGDSDDDDLATSDHEDGERV